MEYTFAQAYAIRTLVDDLLGFSINRWDILAG